MERIDRIVTHPVFLECVEKNRLAETDRKYCRHDMSHFIDVARIARILCLEEKLDIDAELVYAAALLHDIGRYRQYEDGTPHEEASAEIAAGILEDCGFGRGDAELVTEAILSHRDRGIPEDKGLKGLLYRADKASRLCFMCSARGDCRWPDEKKNQQTLFV